MSAKLVKDYLGRRGKKGDQGLELEVEASAPLPELTTEHWVTKLEPSLRGGEGTTKEYISNGILQAYQVPRAISYLSSKLEDPKLGVKKDSTRTSFHVHNNVLYLLPVQLWTAITAYWLTENVLFSQLPGHRRGNHFCLRLSDAEGVLRDCIKDLKRPTPFSSFVGHNNRYSGQNLEAIVKFGSLEYRGMEGSIDPTRLTDWASELHSLTSKVPTTWDSPEALMDDYYAQGAAHFLDRIFSPKFLEPIKKLDFGGMMEENEGALLELAYFHDWKAWQEKIEKNLEEKKQEPKTITELFNEGEQADVVPSAYVDVGLPLQSRPSPQGDAWAAAHTQGGVTIRGSW